MLVCDSSLIDTLPERIRNRITEAAEPHPDLGTHCWICSGRSTRNGYARVAWNGKEPVAHRVVFTLAGGKIPKDKPILDHLCRTRRCVRPDHLEPVTHQENTLRGEAVLFSPKQ